MLPLDTDCHLDQICWQDMLQQLWTHSLQSHHPEEVKLHDFVKQFFFYFFYFDGWDVVHGIHGQVPGFHVLSSHDVKNLRN